MLSFWGNTSTNIGLWKVSAGGGITPYTGIPSKVKWMSLKEQHVYRTTIYWLTHLNLYGGGGVENLGLERT